MTDPDIYRRIEKLEKIIETMRSAEVAAGTYPAVSGLTTGTVLRATSATSAAFGAVDLANAAAVTGTLPDARLSANVPLLNAANTFSANQYIVGDVGVNTSSPATGPFTTYSSKGIQIAGVGSHAGLFLNGSTGNGGFIFMGAAGTSRYHFGGNATSFSIVRTGIAVDFQIDGSGNVLLPSIPRNPSSGTISGYATGTLYADASGFIKIK